MAGGCRSSGEAPADAWGTTHLKYSVEYSDGSKQVEYSGAHEGDSCGFSCDAVSLRADSIMGVFLGSPGCDTDTVYVAG